MFQRIFNLSNLTLFTALTLSGIAAWYSILGLIAIFSSAVIPIIVMGGSLEVAKVVTTVWMHRYWKFINWKLKLYLVPAVVILAFLTSMGIFGFLSKSHSDQSLVSGDSLAKLSIIDEKIKVSKDQIETNRKSLKQMDEAVDQVMARSADEKGADKSNAIRKSQQKERTRLLSEIETEQKKILALNEERAPLAAANRKIEAEVGPIKYIAALIYGDNPDTNLLERAVRWVIILIVIVFDPLALTLVVASNSSRKWDLIKEEEKEEKEDTTEETLEEPKEENIPPNVTDMTVIEPPTENIVEKDVEDNILKDHPYLFNKPKSYHPPGVEITPPMVYKPDTSKSEDIVETTIDQPEETTIQDSNIDADITADTDSPAIITEGVTKEFPLKEIDDEYVSFEGKIIRKDALKEIKPEYFMLTSDQADRPNSKFGEIFPKVAKRGEYYVRTDVFPNKVFKFDGSRWIEVVKSLFDLYLNDKEYLQFLVSKIQSGEYDIHNMSDIEREKIAEYLNSQIS